ncbi:hypothetical protein [Urbifossiella limnaea]|uniref:Uncharacterized protein n=1 Tax=Urbifossiella limnaea TaxID=2528023 RepID=A0A517XPF0_9BACT|nr:hypothetical protein [Urbifossiella limnaea]QDU19366.1 hypothetical protein ETAA1_12730 [Urbifossiella limnaea]
MFNGNAMLALLDARPFTPFRFHLSDGGTVDVPSREMVMPGKTFAVVGLPDKGRNERFLSWWTTVWYMHVTRVEMLAPGAPPFTAPPPAGTDVPSPVAG